MSRHEGMWPAPAAAAALVAIVAVMVGDRVSLFTPPERIGAATVGARSAKSAPGGAHYGNGSDPHNAWMRARHGARPIAGTVRQKIIFRGPTLLHANHGH